MSVEVICPDCGGVIGGASSSRGPCTCAVPETHSYTPPAHVERTASDQEDRGNVGGAEKICIVCGKNVAGHRRVKDSRGYTCYDCVKAERANEIAGTIPCAECGRRVREQGIVDYNGLKICRKCHLEHLEHDKHKPRQIKTAQFDAHEKRNIIILAIVVAVLGLIVLWRQLIAH